MFLYKHKHSVGRKESSKIGNPESKVYENKNSKGFVNPYWLTLILVWLLAPYSTFLLGYTSRSMER